MSVASADRCLTLLVRLQCKAGRKHFTRDRRQACAFNQQQEKRHAHFISNRCLALMVAGQGVWEGHGRTSRTGACWHASGRVAEEAHADTYMPLAEQPPIWSTANKATRPAIGLIVAGHRHAAQC